MPQVICSKGLHYYNPNLHDSCPHCGPDKPKTLSLDPESNEAAGKTGPAHEDGTHRKNVTEIEVTHEKDPAKTDNTIGTVLLGPGGKPLEGGQNSPVVGWLVIVDGPGIGRDFHLTSGFNTIGRSNKMKVSLDIGKDSDSTISRDTHARIIYDNNSNTFYAQSGDNVVNLPTLNGQSILDRQKLSAYDIIQLGKTKLLFVPLCGEKFTW